MGDGKFTFMDPYKSLKTCQPTPLLTQHFALREKSEYKHRFNGSAVSQKLIKCVTISKTTKFSKSNPNTVNPPLSPPGGGGLIEMGGLFERVK